MPHLIGAVTTCREGLSCLIKVSKSRTHLATRPNLLAVILFLCSMYQRLFALCVTVFSWMSRDTSLVRLRASKEDCCFCVRAVETLLSNLVSAESKGSSGKFVQLKSLWDIDQMKPFSATVVLKITKIINNVIFREFC